MRHPSHALLLVPPQHVALAPVPLPAWREFGVGLDALNRGFAPRTARGIQLLLSPGLNRPVGAQSDVAVGPGLDPLDGLPGGILVPEPAAPPDESLPALG